MKKTDLLHPIKVQVKRSHSGLGLFTKEAVKKGQFIIEYKGPILNDAQVQKKGGKYLFEISRHKTVDGSSRKNVARYINHSCHPNSEIIVRWGKVLVVAKKNIPANSELEYDYEKEYFVEFIKPYGCRCGKPPHRYGSRKKAK